MNESGDAQVLLPKGYKLLEKLGQGSGSEVWAVEYKGKKIALKKSRSKDAGRRLQREFAILKRLEIEGVLKVFDSGEHEGMDYFSMELVEGLPFTEYIIALRNQDGFTDIFLDVFQKAAFILSEFHHQGIVHIDIKPANLLVKGDGEPVFLDFGFAEDYVLSPTSEPSGTTLDYAAPELFSGGYVTPAADIYSLGAVCYESLKGERLWKERKIRELIKAKLKSPPGLGNLAFEMPQGVETLVLRMLNPEPSLRPSADEIILEIDWFRKGKQSARSKSFRAPLPKLVFGGRNKELGDIERLVFDDRKVVFLSGQSGTGKTRLLRELRFKSILKNRNVLFFEGRGPHLSLTEHISSIFGIPEATTGDRWRRYEGISQAIRNGGFQGVLIDAPVDIKEDEKGLLGYLARSFDSNLGLLFAQTPADVYPEAESITLGLLDEKSVEELVSKTFTMKADSEKLAKTLCSTGNGNPRRMNELLEILYDEGWLSWKGGWVYKPAEEKKGLSLRLEGWLDESIKRLDEDSRKTLYALSLLDSALPEDVFPRIIGDSAVLTLKNLVSKDLVRPFLYLGIPHYEFANDIIKPYLRIRMRESDKEKLSLEFADALETYSLNLWGEDTNSWDVKYLAASGLLFRQAGDMKKASKYLVDSAKRLIDLGDSEQAKAFLMKIAEEEIDADSKKEALFALGRIAHLEHDMKRVEEYYTAALPLMDGEPEEQAEVYLRIGLAYQRIADYAKAAYFFDRSEELAHEAKGELKARQLYARGWNATLQGRMEEGYKMHKQSFRNASSGVEKARALAGISAALLRSGKAKKALPYIKRALVFVGESDFKISVIIYLIDAMLSLGNFEKVETILDEALLFTKGARFPALSVEMMSLKALYLYNSGRYNEALTIVREAIHISEMINDLYRIDSLRMSEAYCLAALGNWRDSQKNLQAVWKKYHNHARVLKPFSLREWAVLHHYTGNYYIAERMFTKAASIFKTNNDKRELFRTEIRLCRATLDSGDIERARLTVAECRSKLLDTDEYYAEILIPLVESEILLREGKVENSLNCAQDAKAKLDRYKTGFGTLKSDVSLTLGKALAASGKVNEGLKTLTQSLEIAVSQNDPCKQVLALLEISSILFKSGKDIEKAQSFLAEAGTIAQRLGADGIIKKVKEFQNMQRESRNEQVADDNEYLHELSQMSQLIKDLRSKHLAEKDKESGLSEKYLLGLKIISELINTRLGEENFMDELLEKVLELTAAKRGSVFLLDGDKLHPVASRHMDEVTSADARRISETVLQQIQKGLKPIYTPDASTDDRFSRSQSILMNDIRSLLCIPLKTGDKLSGTIYVDSTEPGLFDKENTLYFEAIGNILAATIEQSSEFKRLHREMALLRRRHEFDRSGIVLGKSPAAAKLYAQLEKVAGSNANVLLEGETGTGKGVFARLIHAQSERRDRDFCSINCGILPETIFESELFGAKKGSYTGANQDRAGLLESANCSTVFFDEVTNTSFGMQAKLLEVIEEKVIRRIGESKKRQVDLRFIFATNRDLSAEVKAGRFREDLYFRISAITLHVPPLRERAEDIEEYVRFFLKRLSKELNKDVKDIDKDALKTLSFYAWPGNIRELRNVIERSVLLSAGTTITSRLLEQNFPYFSDGSTDLESSKDLNLEKAVLETEKRLIKEALRRCNTVEEAAQALGISPRSLWRKKKATES